MSRILYCKLSKFWNESSPCWCMLHVFVRHLDFIDLLPKLICSLLLSFNKNPTTCITYWQRIHPSEETSTCQSGIYVQLNSSVGGQVCLIILLVQHYYRGIYNRVTIADSGWDPFFGIHSMGFNLLALDDLFGVFFICVMSFADLYIILLVLQMYSVHSTVQHDLATIIGMNQVQQWILGMRYRNMSNYKHKASMNSSITVPLN